MQLTDFDKILDIVLMVLALINVVTATYQEVWNDNQEKAMQDRVQAILFLVIIAAT